MPPWGTVSSGACPLDGKGTPAACEGAGVGGKEKGVCQNACILLRLLRSQLRLRLEMATLGIVETSFPSALA